MHSKKGRVVYILCTCYDYTMKYTSFWKGRRVRCTVIGTNVLLLRHDSIREPLEVVVLLRAVVTVALNDQI
jgi:hypothetical protein